jgi:hypothetical protein
METIPVVVEIEETEETEHEILGTTRGRSEKKTIIGIKEIDADTLKNSLKALCDQITSFMSDVKEAGQFQLDEVNVQAQVTAEGGVALIGTAKAGIKGAINLTFKKQEKRKDTTQKS